MTGEINRREPIFKSGLLRRNFNLNPKGSERATHVQNDRKSIPGTGNRARQGHRPCQCRNQEKTNMTAEYPHRSWETTFTGWLPRITHLFLK